MGKAKRWIAAITAVSLAAFGGYKGLSWLKEKNAPKVTVVDVAELMTEDYDDYDYYDSSLSGSIAMNVTQNIRIDKDIIVGDLLVNVGDEVKQGDLLMTIDTTLSEMELGLQDLKLQQLRQNLDKANNRLYSLQHGGPIDEETSDTGSDSGGDSGDSDTIVIRDSGGEYVEGVSGDEYYEGDTGDLNYGGDSGIEYSEGDTGDLYYGGGSGVEYSEGGTGDLYLEGDTGGEYIGGDLSDEYVEGDYNGDEGVLFGMNNTHEGAPAYLAAAMPLISFFNDEKTVPVGDVAELVTEETLVTEDNSLTETGELLPEETIDLGSDTGITDTIEPGDGYETLPGEIIPETEIPGDGLIQEEIPVDEFQDEIIWEEEQPLPQEGTGDISEEFPEELDIGNELVEDDLGEDELTELTEDGLTPTPTLSPTPAAEEHPDRTPTVPDVLPDEIELYKVLDYESDPISGSGTNEDPFVYICSSLEESIIMKGSFINLMAGLSYDGSRVLNEEGYWFALVFFENDELPDLNAEDPDLSGVSYIVYNGAADFVTPFDPEEEMEIFVSEAQPYTPETEEETGEEYVVTETWEEDYSVDEGDTSEPSMTRDEAIKQQEQTIKDLELGIKQGEKELTRLQKRCEIKEIRSRIDGTVSYTGNPDAGTSSMDSFLRVKSKDGYYVAGQVSEMMLDQIAPGSVVICTTDMGEAFDAEVIDVSPYPDTSATTTDYSSGNPNASVYGFTATIAQQDLDINEDTWLISVALPQSGLDQPNGLTINKAFVRSENGRSYVMKEENGVLVKQYVRVGKVDSYGYSITITGGLSTEDKLAFPYSEDAVEGTKTVQGTLDDLYDYSDAMF